jgi:hypothetical protein
MVYYFHNFLTITRRTSTMVITKLIRWGGIATLVAGLLLIAAEIVYIVFPSAGSQIMSAPGRIFGTLCMAGAVLLTAGLIGFYLRQAEAAGTFGLVAFLVALTGSALMICSDWNELFAGPALLQVPGIEESFPITLIAGYMINVGVYILGWVLLGVASFRARVFPRPLAILLAVGAPVLLIQVPGSSLPLYIAFAWMGLVVVRNKVAAAHAALPSTATSV